MEEPIIVEDAVVIKDETSPVRRLVMPALEALDDLSEFELSAALRGTAKQLSKETARDPQTYLKERQLIQLVQKQPVLYNCRHSEFHDEEHKQRIWQRIARQLSLEVCKCKNTWAELRYRYQQYVRRLRVYRRETQRRVRKLLRPTMLHGEDLLFLYPHVARQPLLRQRKPVVAVADAEPPEDPEVIIVSSGPAVTIIDLDEDYTAHFEISAFQHRLIKAVHAYPHLYDSSHPDYTNYPNRGYIWSAISNELHEQATKLMKIWLYLQTRYEWELMHNVRQSPLITTLGFMEEHMRKNEHTVYKMSMYLQDAWYAPIENFRCIMQLITILKSLPELSQMVEDVLEKKAKPQRYDALWQQVAEQLPSSHQNCEVTWLVLRNYYLELAEMRRTGYKLKDRWFFEKILADFYSRGTIRKKRRAQKRIMSTTSTILSIEYISDDDEPPAKRLPPPTSKTKSTNKPTTNEAGTNTSCGTSTSIGTSSSTNSSKSRRSSNINNTTSTVASSAVTTSSGISCTSSSSVTSSTSSSKPRNSIVVASNSIVLFSDTVAPISASSSREAAKNIPSSGISCTTSSTISGTSSITSSSTTSSTGSILSSTKAGNSGITVRKPNVSIPASTSTSITISSGIGCTTSTSSSSSSNMSSSTSSIKAKNKNNKASNVPIPTSISSGSSSARNSNIMASSTVASIQPASISCNTACSSSPNHASFIKARNSLIMSNNNIAAISAIARNTANISTSSGISCTSSSTTSSASSSSASCTTSTSSTSSTSPASTSITRKVANIIASSGISCTSSTTSSVTTTTTSSRRIIKLVTMLPEPGTANPGSKSTTTAAVNGAVPIVKLKPVPVAMVAGTPLKTNLVKPLKVVPQAKPVLPQPKPAPPSLVPLPKPSLPNMLPLSQPASSNVQPTESPLPKPAPPNLMPLRQASKHPFNQIPLSKASTQPFNEGTRSKQMPEAQPLLKPLPLNVLAETSTPVTEHHVNPVSMVPWHKVQPFSQSPPPCNEQPRPMVSLPNVDPLTAPQTQPPNVDPLSVEILPKVEPSPVSLPPCNEEPPPMVSLPNVVPLPEAQTQPPIVEPPAQPPNADPLSVKLLPKVEPLPKSAPPCNEKPPPMVSLPNVYPLPKEPTQPPNVETVPEPPTQPPNVDPLPDSPPTSNEKSRPVAPSPIVVPLPKAPTQPPNVDPLPMVTEPMSKSPLQSNQESQPSNVEPPAKSAPPSNKEPQSNSTKPSNEEPPPKTPLPNVEPPSKTPLPNVESPPTSNVAPLAKSLPASMAKSKQPSIEQPLPKTPPPSIEHPLPTASPIAHVITVAFFEDATAGRQLKIVGGLPPSATVLTMPRVIMFIREVMAIPQLHNKDPSLKPKIEELWPQISRKYNLPDNICRALFYYWARNLGVFPQIAPMTELMRPFRSNLKVWEKSHRLFSKFDEIARNNNWVKPQLPELMKHLRQYEFLYWDLRRPRPDDPAGPLQPPREVTDEEKEEVWREAAERFPNMNHEDIWSMFKYAFRTYMEDLERGVENPWPQEWWHALQQLKFLINVRYHPMDPYYYIVHNKFVAEVRRCNMYDRLMQPELNAKELPRKEQMTPWELEETEKEIKLKQEKTDQEQKEQKKKEQEMKEKEEKEQQQKQKDVEEQEQQQKQKDIEEQEQQQKQKDIEEQEQNKANKLLTEQSNQAEQQEQEKGQEKEQEKEQEQAMEQDQTGDQQQVTEQAKQQELVAVTHQEPDATAPSESDSTESVQNGTTLLEVYLTEANEDSSSYLDGMPVLEPVPDTDKITPKELPSVDPYQLTRLLRCYPATYGKANTATKRRAWVEVAKELNTTVTQCRLGMQHALREERLLKLTDPKETCKLSAKYYHHMSEIYQHVQAGGELKPQTSEEIEKQLQQEAIRSPVKPENFIPDINFSSCSSNLVLKNWAYGACKMRLEQQRQLRPRLKEIFARYEKLAEKNCPNDSLTKK